jgi:hypothetical protein
VDRPLVSVVRTEGAPAGAIDARFKAVADLRSAARAWLDGRGAGASNGHAAGASITLPNLPDMVMLFLKQIPDETANTGACYRAIVEAPMTLLDRHVKGGTLPGPYDVALHRYASHQIASTLGLRVERAEASLDHLRPVAQFWTRAYARLQPGRVVSDSRAPAPAARAANGFAASVLGGMAERATSLFGSAERGLGRFVGRWGVSLNGRRDA